MTEPARFRAVPAFALALLALLLSAAPAAAHKASAGGTQFTEPEVTELKCGTGDRSACPRGHVLRLSGEGLARTRKVVFLGGRGRRDDRTARPTERSPHRVIVSVPRSARSGRIRVVTGGATATGPRLKVLAASVRRVTAVPAVDGGVFPVQGPHEYGTETNRFGGGRGHEGQDVFAECGTPLVAALETAGELLHPLLRERLAAASRAIAEGQRLSASMESSGLTTPIAARMLAVGESGGNIGEMLENIAAFHDEEMARWVDWFTRLFEPILMALIGLVIGVIVILMYMPIFELAGGLQ